MSPGHPRSCSEHNCLISRFGPEWSFKGRNGRPFGVRVRGNAVINSGDALREAVVAGTGIAQGTWWLYRKDLERGDVRAILRDYELEGAPVSVLYPPQRHLPVKLRAFIDFLVQIRACIVRTRLAHPSAYSAAATARAGRKAGMISRGEGAQIGDRGARDRRTACC